MTDAYDDRREALLRTCIPSWFRSDPPHGDFAFLLRRLDEARAAHDRRVTELLAANNALLERARAAEDERSMLSAQMIAAAVKLAEAEDRLRWRPIETAPKDEPVLLYCPEREPITNRERIDLSYAHTSRGSHHAWATHWLPLPEKGSTTLGTPIMMILHCPECGERHVDRGEFATKPHHTHACQACGMVWRPAIVPTVGVRFLPGFKDEDDADG